MMIKYMNNEDNDITYFICSFPIATFVIQLSPIVILLLSIFFLCTPYAHRKSPSHRALRAEGV